MSPFWGCIFLRSYFPTGHCWATPADLRPGGSSSFIVECPALPRPVKKIASPSIPGENSPGLFPQFEFHRQWCLCFIVIKVALHCKNISSQMENCFCLCQCMCSVFLIQHIWCPVVKSFQMLTEVIEGYTMWEIQSSFDKRGSRKSDMKIYLLIFSAIIKGI